MTLTKTATRLLGSSSKNSYDPGLDIDWDAPPIDGMAYLPFERASLYGTPMWEQMSHEQRIELTKQEVASIASTGLWFEIILIQMLTRYAYHRDARDPQTQYALTEIGDETRHVIMFAKTLEALDAPHYRPNKFLHHAARVYKATARGPMVFGPVLVAEEMTDRLQRTTMHDESIHPLIRMVNRIHVVEEARHVRFAREEITRTVPGLSRGKLAWNQLVTAVVAVAVAESLVSPDVYANAGLDAREARKQARENQHFAETKRWMAEKIMAFLQENGMVPRWSRPIYRLGKLI
jgi:P-aminobenzoate N-oxygenase AurF